MVPVKRFNHAVDPVTFLDQTIEGIWDEVCNRYDICPEPLPLKMVFEGADLAVPRLASETVIVNILLYAIEQLGRFSDCYNLPARAFGLVSLWDHSLKKYQWVLANEAVHEWQEWLDSLTKAIELNIPVLKACLFVDNLIVADLTKGPKVKVKCACDPPRVIEVTRKVYQAAPIICDACKEAFS